ncbi:MAG: transglycosylase SLT domain-containing protein [Bacteroidales bacterium]|nr:transglycosylase SLT domain-containing protein [Bacteroidales bacterium]
MKLTKHSWLFLFIACLIAGFFIVYNFFNPRYPDKVINEGACYVENKTNKLSILLYCNSSDYFLYKGMPIGFQYELLKMMGNSLDMEISITYSDSPDFIKEHLHGSDYDIIAIDVDSTELGKRSLVFSLSHSSSYPVLVQRIEDESASLRKILYVPAHFPGTIVLDSIPGDDEFLIMRSSTMEADEMFGLLQDGKIHYLVSDYNTAITLLPFYSDLKISNQIGATYRRKWILNPANKKINDLINNWLTNFKQTADYQKLCTKYFSPKSKFLHNASVEKRHGRISQYDKIIKKYAKKQHLDWRFVSSIIFQESRFTSDGLGVGGSFGIMQLMPETAARYGIDSTSNIEQQLWAGIQLISFLNKLFIDIEDEMERSYFVAASYNAGPGHIIDACNLCRKFGDNYQLWENVKVYLALKSEKEFYNDPVVKNGYYPGRHTIRYTQQVMERYQAYKITLPR